MLAVMKKQDCDKCSKEAEKGGLFGDLAKN